LFELESLARGVVVADVVVKQAAVHVSIAEPITPGKYLLVFSGGVAEVDEAFRAGEEAGGAMIIDRLYLPHVDESLVAMLEGDQGPGSGQHDSLGIIELHTVAATLLAADTALKRAQVRLTHLQLARGIGGKGWFTIAGAQHDVEAAIEGAAAAVQPPLIVATEFIRRPHVDLRGRVIA
jgi:microcompartment protein CcmL/EutN